MFAADRDLIVLEPNLFRDVAWVGQTLVAGTGSITGTALVMTSQTQGFDAAGVDAGNVLLANGVAYEVVSRISASVLSVSVPRGDVADAPVAPLPVGSTPMSVVTFGPQIVQVHRQVLRMLGIDPDDPEATLGEASVTNPGSLRRLEALGAMHLVLAAAGGPAGPESPLALRAEMYAARFADERRRVSARIDLDGDGVADATRRLNIVQFVRG